MIDVKHIAKLARLGLSEGESERFTQELLAILEFIKKLEEVDIVDIEPTAQVTGRQNVSRSDESLPADTLVKKEILANAPELKENFIKVKTVFE